MVTNGRLEGLSAEKASWQALLGWGTLCLWLAAAAFLACLLRAQAGTGERLLEEARISRALAGYPSGVPVGRSVRRQ